MRRLVLLVCFSGILVYTNIAIAQDDSLSTTQACCDEIAVALDERDWVVEYGQSIFRMLTQHGTPLLNTHLKIFFLYILINEYNH